MDVCNQMFKTCSRLEAREFQYEIPAFDNFLCLSFFM